MPLTKLPWIFLLLSLLGVMAAVAGLHAFFPWDISLSDKFFDFTARDGVPLAHWLLPKTNPTLTIVFHEVPRWGFILLGASCAALWCGGFVYPRLAPYRRYAFYVVLALILVPASVALLKNAIPAYCPSKLQHYGGYAPDDYKQHVLSPLESRRADCFPAAHPAAGFALMIFGTLAATRRGRLAGYALGLAAGMALSLVQIARGEHFLSHCVATALIAWWIAQILGRSSWNKS